jgi:hypothetical protein
MANRGRFSFLAPVVSKRVLYGEALSVFLLVCALAHIQEVCFLNVRCRSPRKTCGFFETDQQTMVMSQICRCETVPEFADVFGKFREE